MGSSCLNFWNNGLNFTSLVLQMSARICPHAFPGSAFQGMTPEVTEHHLMKRNFLPWLVGEIYFSVIYYNFWNNRRAWMCTLNLIGKLELNWTDWNCLYLNSLLSNSTNWGSNPGHCYSSTAIRPLQYSAMNVLITLINYYRYGSCRCNFRVRFHNVIGLHSYYTNWSGSPNIIQCTHEKRVKWSSV